MSELQAEQEVIDGIPEEENQVTPETEQPETVSESAPDSGESHEEKIEFTEAQQRIFDEAISKKVFKTREAEREAERLKRELKETKAKLPQKTRPVIPGIPDSLELTDEEFQAELAKRDEAIREAAAFDADQKAELRRQEEVQQQQAEKAQKDFEARVDNYVQNAHKLGVSDAELSHAGKIVEAYGIEQQLADHLLQSDQGPLITLYLSQNQLELDSLRQLDPLSAAVRIETLIKPKAAALKAQTTSAPDPVETLSGAGVPPKERGPKGATFE